MRKDHWVPQDHQGLRAHQAHRVPRADLAQTVKMVTPVHRERRVLQALEEMMESPVKQENQENLGLVDSLVQMVILAIRAILDHRVPRDPQAPSDHRVREETGDPLEKEEPPVPREIQDHKDYQEVKDRAVIPVRKEKKDYKGHREKREIRDGLVSLVQQVLQVLWVIRATQVLPGRVDSKGPKATEVKTALTDLPVHPGKLGLGEEAAYRVPRETGDHKERGATQEIQDQLDHRDLLETSAHI